MLKNVLSFSHLLIKESLSKGETAIDATAGRGNDTLFLSKVVGETGRVMAFDIQEEAVEATRLLLSTENRNNVSVTRTDHAVLGEVLNREGVIEIGGAIFNLGYLPGSSKEITTAPASTLKAASSLLPLLKPGGLIVMVVYYGHPGGAEEKESLLHFCSQLDQKQFHALKYDFINRKNSPPFLLAIEKRK